jgi:hypothetical protein
MGSENPSLMFNCESGRLSRENASKQVFGLRDELHQHLAEASTDSAWTFSDSDFIIKLECLSDLLE